MADLNLNDLKAGVAVRIGENRFVVRKIIGVSFLQMFASVDVLAKDGGHWTLHCFYNGNGQTELTGKRMLFHGGTFGEQSQPAEILKEAVAQS